MNKKIFVFLVGVCSLNSLTATQQTEHFNPNAYIYKACQAFQDAVEAATSQKLSKTFSELAFDMKSITPEDTECLGKLLEDGKLSVKKTEMPEEKNPARQNLLRWTLTGLKKAAAERNPEHFLRFAIPFLHLPPPHCGVISVIF
ncbi:MAG: hypothetical protein LBL99_02855 [Holosporaceae bacterium]|nr:hypothetical protein [Holosporaceae bacterium]